MGSGTLLCAEHTGFLFYRENTCNIEKKSKNLCKLGFVYSCIFVLCASIIQNKHNKVKISQNGLQSD